MIDALVEGRVDILAANLTVTPERLKRVDFSPPTLKHVAEIVVTGPAAPEIVTLDDLAAVRSACPAVQQLPRTSGDAERCSVGRRTAADPCRGR